MCSQHRCRPAILTVFLVFLLLLISSTFYPLTWDEGELNRRAEGATFRTGTTSAEGHPQWPVLLCVAGRKLAPSFLPERAKIRFGHVLFFSVAVGCVFYRLETEFGPAAAVFGILSILLVPRLFAHAQIAAWDSPLIAAWLLAWVFFPSALRSNSGAVLYGIAVGLTVASKFSGFGVLLPPLVWSAVRLKRKRVETEVLKRGVIALLFALFVFFVLNPPLWGDPIGGICTHVRLNMNRTLSISILFLGRMYDLHHSLPWYNTLFWTFITVPAGLLALGAVGVTVSLRDEKERRAGCWLLLNMSTLLVIRALPGTPVHDGVRLFIPAFAFLGIFAGIGAAALWNVSARKRLCRTIVAGTYAVCLFNMFWYAPQWLSYYNILIGGLPGAVRAGMEPTYYWDGFDSETIGWLSAHTDPGERVLFSVGSRRTFEIYRRENKIEFVCDFCPPEDFQKEIRSGTVHFYVLQRRPSAEFEGDRYLIEHEKPVFVKTIRRGGFGPWNLGAVPIIEVYDLSCGND